MDWKNLHDRTLTFALIAVICYIPFFAFLTVTSITLRFPQPEVLIHLAPLLSIPKTIAIIAAIVALASFAASRGFRIFGWMVVLACSLWFACEVIIFTLVTWATYIGYPSRGFASLYELTGTIKIAFYNPIILLGFVFTPFILLATRDLQGNSLVKFLTGVALPLIFAAAYWGAQPAITVVTLAFGGLVLWNMTDTKPQPVTILFSLFTVLIIANFANAAQKEIAVLTSELPKHALQLGISRGPGAAIPAVLLLAPLLAAMLSQPLISTRLKRAILAIFTLTLISWLIVVFPSLRSGMSSILTAPDFRPIAILDVVDAAPGAQLIPFTHLILIILWLTTALLSLWCYLQVWKAR